MTIRVVNANFVSTSTGEHATLDAAYRAAVLAGIEIAANEVSEGLKSTIVRVSVDLDGRANAAEGAVAISTQRFVDRAPS